MLTALGTIDALDVDARPARARSSGRATSTRAAYFLQGPGRERLPALFAAARAPRPDDVVRHELGPVRAVGR